MRILASLPRCAVLGRAVLGRAALAVGLLAGAAALSGCIATADGGIYRGPPLQVHGTYVQRAEPPRIVVLPRAYRVDPHVHGRWYVPPPVHADRWPGIGRPDLDWRNRDRRNRGWHGRHRFAPGFGAGRFHRAPGWNPGWPAVRSPLRDNGRCDDRRYETSNGGRVAPGMDEYDCSRFGGGLKGKYR